MSTPRGGYRMATLDNGSRVKVATRDGIDGYMCRWTTYCAGCCDDSENVTNYIGSGCADCAYTGKSRQHWWEPLDPMYWEKPIYQCEPS